MVQHLRLCASMAGDMGLIPGLGTKILQCCKAQLRPPHPKRVRKRRGGGNAHCCCVLPAQVLRTKRCKG